MDSEWYVYMIQCGDGTIYTGIATDVERRLEQHRAGTGAKYTRGRGPLQLVYVASCGNHSQALKTEWKIKKLSRNEKLALISAYLSDK